VQIILNIFWIRNQNFAFQHRIFSRISTFSFKILNCNNSPKSLHSDILESYLNISAYEIIVEFERKTGYLYLTGYVTDKFLTEQSARKVRIFSNKNEVNNKCHLLLCIVNISYSFVKYIFCSFSGIFLGALVMAFFTFDALNSIKALIYAVE
jgi:hypothetical protein